jgi:hypothetical protein
VTEPPDDFAYFAIGLGKKLLIAEPLTMVNNELFKAAASYR